jgi:hypothetical protein
VQLTFIIGHHNTYSRRHLLAASNAVDSINPTAGICLAVHNNLGSASKGSQHVRAPGVDHPSVISSGASAHLMCAGDKTSAEPQSPGLALLKLLDSSWRPKDPKSTCGQV